MSFCSSGVIFRAYCSAVLAVCVVLVDLVALEAFWREALADSMQKLSA